MTSVNTLCTFIWDQLTPLCTVTANIEITQQSCEACCTVLQLINQHLIPAGVLIKIIANMK